MGNIYTKMKIFHFKEKIDSLPREKGKVLAPIHIRIKPTNVCNHNCSYCAYRADDLQLGKDMVQRDFISKEKMMEIIDDVIEMGVKSVTFSGGGDPFCYPYLFDAAKRLSESDVKFASLTNGALLDGEKAEIFAKNASWIRISMDGWDDESYSEYRGVPKGEFTKVLNNIKNFKTYNGACFLGVCIIVDKKNASHVYELAEQIRESGANSVKIAPCIVSNSGKENNEYHEPIFDKVKVEIARVIKKLGDVDFEIFDSYHGQLETFEKEYSWCPYLQILPVIGADLNIYPCQDKAYNLDEGLIGSIKEVRFKDFWFSDKNKFFKVNPSRHCAHHCVADGKNKLILDYLNVDKNHMGFV
ncbi:MAG: radical SAM protein [Candidatus Omnitrophota bacterium]